MPTPEEIAASFRAEVSDPDNPVFGVENRRRWKWAEARLSLKACPHCGGDLDVEHDRLPA